MTDSSFQNRVGVDAVEIANMSREQLFKILEVSYDPDSPAGNGWVEAAEDLFRLVGNEQEMRWSELSKRFVAKAAPAVDWSQAAPISKYTWEAVVRHAVNLIMAENREEFDYAASYDWRDWILTAVQKQRPNRGEDDGRQ